MDQNIQDGNKDGKALSRNELYTPLRAYEQTRVPPSSYMLNQASVPRALQESSLVSHLQYISQKYHRNLAKASDPKNNGSRPNSFLEVQQRIRSRAVTLIGGGVTSALALEHKVEKKPRKRKRKSWEEIQKIFKAKAQNLDHSSSHGLNSIEFLRKLNATWNKYMSELLQLGEATNRESTIAAKFIASRNHLELVGAHVRIATCSQKIKWKGYSGVLIGESKNTWMVGILRQKKGKASISKLVETIDPASQPTADILVVPKRGSSLIIVIPDPSSATDSTKECNKSDYDELIPLTSQRSTCIALGPSRNNS